MFNHSDDRRPANEIYAGKTSGWNLFYDSYSSGLLDYIYIFTGSRELSRNIFRKVMKKAAEKPSELIGTDSSVMIGLWRIALSEISFEVNSATSTPGNPMEPREITTVKNLLALPPADCLVFLHKYYFQETHRQISKELEISQDEIRQSLERSSAKMGGDFDVNTFTPALKERLNRCRTLDNDVFLAETRELTAEIFQAAAANGRKMPRGIYAAIIAVIAVILIILLTALLTGRDEPQEPAGQGPENTQITQPEALKPSQEPVKEDSPHEEKVPTRTNKVETQTPANVNDELALARQYMFERDVDGLIDLLETGEYSTKVAASVFLGQLGDPQALEPLVRQSLAHSGTETGQVFQAAIKVIIEKNPGFVDALREQVNRLEKTQSEETQPQEQQTGLEPQDETAETPQEPMPEDTADQPDESEYTQEQYTEEYTEESAPQEYAEGQTDQYVEDEYTDESAPEQDTGENTDGYTDQSTDEYGLETESAMPPATGDYPDE
jgi:hypothetical protein